MEGLADTYLIQAVAENAGQPYLDSCVKTGWHLLVTFISGEPNYSAARLHSNSNEN